jgi:hypothetical protein
MMREYNIKECLTGNLIFEEVQSGWLTELAKYVVGVNIGYLELSSNEVGK